MIDTNNLPTLRQVVDYMKKEYTKPDSKLELKESGKKGLKSATLLQECLLSNKNKQGENNGK